MLTWLQVAVFFLLNLFFIHMYGIKGASLGYTISFAVAFLITESYIIQKCLGKSISKSLEAIN